MTEGEDDPGRAHQGEIETGTDDQDPEVLTEDEETDHLTEDGGEGR